MCSVQACFASRERERDSTYQLHPIVFGGGVAVPPSGWGTLRMMMLSVRCSAAAAARKPSIWLVLLLLFAAPAAAHESAAKNKTKPVKATEEPVVSSPGEAEARYSGAVRGDDVWTPPPTTVADAADGGGNGEGPCKTAIERMLSPVRERYL